ncbi:MAG: N-acetylglucosamine-6-phosphate deacetylase [Vicinamibacterales bacterium]
MIVLAGADLVLPDRIVRGGSLVIDGDRIAAVEPRDIDGPGGARRIDLRGHYVVPGFIDVHVHGIEGIDVLHGPTAVSDVASRLPRYGVTAFCPTSVACAPAELTTMLASVAAAQSLPSPRSARVLRAHLESNFINVDWAGAQPLSCLRLPKPDERRQKTEREFSGAEILDVIEAHRRAVGIVTLAPELPGGLELVRDLVSAGHRVSVGHSGATYDETRAAIEAGVRHATHLYNRMSPLTARAPGVVGAVLESDEVAVEVICDGFHVHPTAIGIAVRTKSVDRVMAITDGTAGSGLPAGSRTRLGSHSIVVTATSAVLEDGTLAGSVLTMDAAFRSLVEKVGLGPVEAARMCSTTPATELRLAKMGRIAEGFLADLAVLGPDLRVRQTYLGGVPCWNTASDGLV